MQTMQWLDMIHENNISDIFQTINFFTKLSELIIVFINVVVCATILYPCNNTERSLIRYFHTYQHCRSIVIFVCNRYLLLRFRYSYPTKYAFYRKRTTLYTFTQCGTYNHIVIRPTAYS